jgi:4-amino-4-deoxy-L-arabinose transferase-like glycosyltransferase
MASWWRESWWKRWGLAVCIVVLAAVLRSAFVWWAPRELSGDGYHYHLSGLGLMQGGGYTDIDGSPSIRWMPGWPYLLSVLYTVFGVGPVAPMVFNALAGAATTAVLIRLGRVFWRPSAGWIAGALYAVWPGNIYYCATLMTESVFNLLLMLCVWGLVEAGQATGSKRTSWTLGAGAMFGCLVMIKAETLALLPVVVGLIAATQYNVSFRRNVSIFLAVGSLLLIPWTIRNYGAFDRIVITTATAGANAWLGNHPGASGGQSIVEMRAFMKEHKSANRAETLFAASRSGWARVKQFVHEHPVEVLSIAANKLRLTYGSDAAAAKLVRGVGVGRVGFITEPKLHTLTRVANVYWAAIAIWVAVGLCSWRDWGWSARIVCVGVPLTYLAVHLVFIGGPRFHSPETPAFALIAAAALDRWIPAMRAAVRARR